MTERNRLGLIGRNIGYSFSRNYFTEKFKNLDLKHLRYDNYDFPEIDEFPFIIYMRRDEFIGFNVTIPYKESIIPFLDALDKTAQDIGAVNVIKLDEDDRLVGYNTDAYGFQRAIEPLLKSEHKRALVLGTGGAAKAISFGLKQLGIPSQIVSRTEGKGDLTYEDLDTELMNQHKVVINCTPLGTHPNTDRYPPIPYELLDSEHLLFDLIYNPSETSFMIRGKEMGATVSSGLVMLEQQAERAWEIWNS
jgi:shikimate dehydrogenase